MAGGGGVGALLLPDASAADEEAGDRVYAVFEGNTGTAVAGGVPAGDGLLLDDAEFDCAKWRGRESATAGGVDAIASSECQGSAALSRALVRVYCTASTAVSV